MVKLKGIFVAALVFAFSPFTAGCEGAMGSLVMGLAYDELMGIETSRISFENVGGALYMDEGSAFQLQVMHRQLIDSRYGRNYYEEWVTDECSYYTSAPSVASVTADGRVLAIGKGTAVITAVFKLPLQKADQARLTVVVE